MSNWDIGIERLGPYTSHCALCALHRGGRGKMWIWVQPMVFPMSCKLMLS